MRLEFNPRALCYNLYCDTREEQEKMKRMLETPLTANEVKYIENDVLATKEYLNSIYGKVVTNMNKNYIVVHPTGSCKIAVIFKDKITGVFKHDDGTADVLLESGSMFALLDKYEDIIKCVI